AGSRHLYCHGSQPRLLLLDEPFAGMNFEETWQTVERVRAVRDRGVTVLLVEHDMQTVMRISDRIMVLNFGKKIAEGAPAKSSATRRWWRPISGAKASSLEYDRVSPRQRHRRLIRQG